MITCAWLYGVGGGLSGASVVTISSPRQELRHAGPVTAGVRAREHLHQHSGMRMGMRSLHGWHVMDGKSSARLRGCINVKSKGERAAKGGQRGALLTDSASEVEGSEAAAAEEEACHREVELEEERRPRAACSSDATSELLERAPGIVKRRRRSVEQYTYLFAALASSVGITSLAAGSVYYRFAWQMQGGELSYVEMFGCLSLALGAAVGMEFWARWAHRALWHASLWHMHESHHRPRDGPFELNDIFAITNAIPAITLLAFGFFHKGLFPGLCFGAGLGITVFGMAYMFVHDGLVHRRFPVGPIANVPYFRKVAAAHQLHHADKFHGVPYGLFLGPKELQDVGGQKELDKLSLQRKPNSSKATHIIDV